MSTTPVSARRPMVTSREQARIVREHVQRFGRDPERTRAEYRAQLLTLSAELYPHKRYPGEVA